MKKLNLMLLMVLLVVGLVGCTDKEKQNSVLDYINNDCAQLGEIEEQLLDSYNSVTGDNYVDDEIMYTELSTNTIRLARELNDMAVEVAANIEDEEVMDVHKIYMNYSNKYLVTIGIAIAALENQSIEQVTEANEKLNEANNLAIDFERELYDLAEKYDVEIYNK